jgi:hypothetical protein
MASKGPKLLLLPAFPKGKSGGKGCQLLAPHGRNPRGGSRPLGLRLGHPRHLPFPFRARRLNPTGPFPGDAHAFRRLPRPGALWLRLPSLLAPRLSHRALGGVLKGSGRRGGGGGRLYLGLGGKLGREVSLGPLGGWGKGFFGGRGRFCEGQAHGDRTLPRERGGRKPQEEGEEEEVQEEGKACGPAAEPRPMGIGGGEATGGEAQAPPP